MQHYMWAERLVPDFDSCIALQTMNFPQKNTQFVWVRMPVITLNGEPSYKLFRRVEVEANETMFAAYTAEEFQSVLPINFVPVRMRDNSWIIVDLHGTTISNKKEDKAHFHGVTLARVNGSMADRAAQAFANAAIFLIQTGAIKK